MRMKWWLTVGLALSFGLILATPSGASAQDDEILMPAQSTAKAKQILQAAIQALGGPAYLNVQDVTCTGNLSQFDHSGAVTGFGKFIDYSMPPDKERQENIPKRNIIEVYNGKHGWVLDRGGVSDAPASDLAQFQQDHLTDIDNILRHRIHEPGMILRYAGPDIVELKQVDWVELVDSDNRTIRIAFDRATHLPIQEIAEARDPKTQLRDKQTQYFSDYHPVQQIETPFQLERDRNGIKIFQAFFTKCQYNTGVPESLFTKESLEQRWAKVGKKERKKQKKEKREEQEDKEKERERKEKQSSSHPDW